MKPLHPVAASLSALITVSLFQGVASLARPNGETAPARAATPASSAVWLVDARSAGAPTRRN